jgi:hypothetical protein
LSPKKNLKSSFPLRFPSIGWASKAKRVEGGVPPADLPAEVSTQAGPSQFRSDIFKQTPPIFRIRLPAGKAGILI